MAMTDSERESKLEEKTLEELAKLRAKKEFEEGKASRTRFSDIEKKFPELELGKALGDIKTRGLKEEEDLATQRETNRIQLRDLHSKTEEEAKEWDEIFAEVEGDPELAAEISNEYLKWRDDPERLSKEKRLLEIKDFLVNKYRLAHSNTIEEYKRTKDALKRAESARKADERLAKYETGKKIAKDIGTGIKNVTKPFQVTPQKADYYRPSTSLVGPGSPNLRRQGFQSKGYADYVGQPPMNRAGEAHTVFNKAGAALGTPTPSGSLLQMPNPNERRIQFQQPQRMGWTQPTQVQGPGMGNLRNPGNPFSGMRIAQAQGVGSKLPSPMARPSFGLARPSTSLLESPISMPGLSIGQPSQLETTLEPGEQIIGQYPKKIYFYIGPKRGYELGKDAVIVEMQTGSFRFAGVGLTTGQVRSKIIGKDLNKADEIALKGGL